MRPTKTSNYGSLSTSEPLLGDGQPSSFGQESFSRSQDDGLDDSNVSQIPSMQNIEDKGSTWIGAAFNLASSITGAGCIGLGGAIAKSGGLISLFAILTFAVLSKYSFDLVINLGSEAGDVPKSSVTYEGLGYLTYGSPGKLVVVLSKGIYSIGCLVAYIVIVKDNLSSALCNVLFSRTSSYDPSGIHRILANSDLVTTFFCATVMLPLCFLRDAAPLERFSALKIFAIMLIVIIVVSLMPSNQEDSKQLDVKTHWLEIRPGVWESMGTFVFTFVAQHAIHLVYQSVKPSQQKYFSKATTLGTIMCTAIAMLMGFFVYMTFWEETSSSMFKLYGPSPAVDACRILLCVSMLLTYPFPFLTVRELVVLLAFSESDDRIPVNHTHSNTALLPGSDRQLKLSYHIPLTILIWLVTLICALKASSLGAVLNLSGSLCGTMISYILPAVFSFRIRGITFLGSLLFLLGGSVGLVGTYYSMISLVQ